jgi:hypothetical protein
MSTYDGIYFTDGAKGRHGVMLERLPNQSVSRVLLEDFQIEAQPGRKIECPFCGHRTFGIKTDDSIGKCFHPSCEKFITPAQCDRQYKSGIAVVHDQLFETCRRALLRQKESGGYAWEYLTNERGIHHSVIEAAPIGIIQEGFDGVVEELFTPLIQNALAVVESEEGKPGRKSQEETIGQARLKSLQEARKKLLQCIKGRPGWLCFFYADDKHRILSIKFRQPFSKEIRLKFASTSHLPARVFSVMACSHRFRVTATRKTTTV